MKVDARISALRFVYPFLFRADEFGMRVAAIERASCSGYHLRLPTMVESQARRALAIHACPHCRRMLYAPELITAEALREAGSQKKGAPDRAALASAAERY